MDHPTSPRILLIKTSSLGDVIHNLPVVSDIVSRYPEAHIDWLVEESFASLPKLHPRVDMVIPVAVRRWKRAVFQGSTWREIGALRRSLAQCRYDLIIDTQGLLKSALLGMNAKGPHYGYDLSSAREPLASLFYQHTFPVARLQHAVERNRQLAALALGYNLQGKANFGIHAPDIARLEWLPSARYVVLLHATSRDDKLWEEASWVELGKQLREQEIVCVLPWGSAKEQERSQRLAALIPDAIATPKLNLDQVATLLAGAHAIVGVDTGIAHLAAALHRPTIGIYTATDPLLTGVYQGDLSINLGGIQRSPSVAEVSAAISRLTA
ncbi:MAG: lipopolysaccharide heptosyltransferase I [Gallionella sp.]